MSTDDEMDGRLSAAGTRWRAANPAATVLPDGEFAMAPVAHSTNPSRAVVAASAAAIVAALIGATVYVTTRPSHTVKSATHGGPVAVAPNTALDGPTWLLKSITLHGSLAEPVEGTTLTFDHGRVDGSDGCNHFQGGVSVTSTRLTFSQVASTAMGCTSGLVPDTESAVGAVLQGSAWRLSGGRLELTANDGTVLVYAKAVEPTENPARLVGKWRLTETDQTTTSGDSASGSGSGAVTGSVSGSGSAAGSAGGFDSYLSVAADGTFKTTERCYADTGMIEIGKGSAIFSDVTPAGSIPCPSLTPAQQKDEQTRDSLVDEALNGATNWVIDSAGALTITKGGISLVYRAVK